MTHAKEIWAIEANKTADDDTMICVISSNGVTVWQGYECDRNWQIARLIAAAPELLDALDESIRFIAATKEFRAGHYPGAGGIVERGRAAIRKARP